MSNKYTWRHPITFKRVICPECNWTSQFGKEVDPEGDYDFCIQWLCTKCGALVQETKGYDCQFEGIEEQEQS